MITDKDIIERIEAMLSRPQMYSQNSASLEDQFVLLLMGYGEDPNKLYNEYIHFIRKLGCGNTTLASRFPEYTSLIEKLKLFLNTIVLNDHNTGTKD